MTRKLWMAAAAAGLAALSVTSVRAQEVKADTIKLSGTYSLENVSVSDESVSLTFKATIINNGDASVDGYLKLAEPNNLQRPMADFGSVSIASGGKTDVDANVDVPRSVYDSWSGTGQPTITFAWQDERGDILVHRVPLSRVQARPPS